MTSDTQHELNQLRQFAKPFRYRVRLSSDNEAIMPGVHGQVEWYSCDGKTLVAHTEKVRTLKNLESLSWVIPHEVGETEGSYIFPSARLKEIGQILKLKKLSGSISAPHLAQFQFQLRVSRRLEDMNLVQEG